MWIEHLKQVNFQEIGNYYALLQTQGLSNGHLATENQKMVNKNNILVEADGLARHTWYMNFVCLEIYHKEDFYQVKWFEADSKTLSCPVLLQLSAKIIWKLWINASYTM